MALINKIENPFFMDKYLEISTARVLVLNPATKQEIFMCEMSADELTQKVDEEKIKADIDNHTVAVINKNKEITFKATEVVTRKELQLAKLQAKIENGTVKAWHFPKQYEVKSGLKIILDQMPADETEVNIYDNNTKKRLDPSKYTITGREVVFDPASGAVEGENILVTSFQFSLSADYADIGTDNIPSVVSLIIMKPVFDTNDTIAFYKQYFFPKCKMDANITLKGETEKKNSPEDTNFTIMKADSYNYLGRMIYVPANQIDVEEDIDILPVSDLDATPADDSASFAWTAIANGATNVKLQYKLTSGSTFTDVPVGSTGIHIASALNNASATATILGLADTTSYDVRLFYMIDNIPYRSNVETFTTL